MFGRASMLKPMTSRMVGRKNMSTLPVFLYNNVWQKSTAKYVSYVMVMLVAGDYMYNSFFDALWDSVNKGVSIPLYNYTVIVVSIYSIITPVIISRMLHRCMISSMNLY